MVVDSSALVAILLAEADGHVYDAAIARTKDPALSTVSFVECSIVMFRRIGERGLRDLDRTLRANGVRQVPVDRHQAQIARRAWQLYGKGDAPAGLNLGDCFSYALARTLDRPLLFKGGHFAKTDVLVAK